VAEKKRADDGLIAENRRARHDYEISETLECGIELVGAEVKSLRAKSVSFKDSYCLVENDQLVLCGLQIDRWKAASTHEELNPTRKRRLLVHATEIERLRKATQRGGLSIIPLKLYFKGPWAKLLVGLGKGKTHGDKRDSLKRREADRDMERALHARRR
jgi:SsrA-binding protein